MRRMQAALIENHHLAVGIEPDMAQIIARMGQAANHGITVINRQRAPAVGGPRNLIPALRPRRLRDGQSQHAQRDNQPTRTQAVRHKRTHDSDHHSSSAPRAWGGL